MPLFCHHCEDAPCALSCPEEAITRDLETGVVLHNPDKCTGCNAVEGKSGAEKNLTSPCKVNCPAKNDIQGFVGLVAKGKYDEALRLIKMTSPFPSICGRVCTYPCESDCNRKQIDEPVSIRAIERFVADQGRSNGGAYVPEVKAKRDEKVAVIGSGPAGLAAAYFLAINGYGVTVFEKLPVAGGMMAVGIPLYRLPKKVLFSDIGIIQKLGVDIKTGVNFGTDVTLDGLRKDGYQAFFLATGLHRHIRLNVPNEDATGILSGVGFLRDVSLDAPVSLGKRIVVVGGGNVAMDVAMTALRTGATDVTLVCLEQRSEMPAWEREINEALEEGVKIINGWGPKRFLEKGGQVSGVEFKRCVSAFDNGKFSPKYDENDLTTIEADTVIIAAGQAADVSFAQAEGIPTNGGGLKADPLTLETPIQGVFAGGDVVYGPKTVVEAIGSGKEAAVSIDRYLRGLDLRTGREPRESKLVPITEPQKEKYDPAPRSPVMWLSPQARLNDPGELEIGFTEQLAVQEAKRCITCGTSCVQACPYGVMQFNHEALKAVKCDLCIDRRRNNEAPACTWACPAHCIYWGDAATFPGGIEQGLQRIVP
jgi:NADPH-dependent glutamate synthase beta subunit-like oxidoreductase